MGKILTYVWYLFCLALPVYIVVKVVKNAKGHFKTKGFKLGYVIDGKNNFTGVSLDTAEGKNGIIKDTDYTRLIFYKLSETLKDSNTHMGVFTNVVDELDLSDVESYVKGTYDLNWWTFKLVLKDGTTCTIRANKHNNITNTFERVLYMYTNK